MLTAPRLLTCLALLLLCAESRAGNDYVIMKNGDRITGEVEKIWNEEIFIEPEYGDTYAIELEYVAYVHTEEEFEVEFLRGRRTETVLGRLGIDDDGRPMVIVEDGARTYPLSEVDNMLEVEEFFDWEVRSDISVNVATGNTNTNSGRFYAMGKIKLGEHNHKLELTRDGSSTDGDLTKDQTDVYYEDLWTFRDDWFMRGSVTWTKDPLRDLDSRSQFYLGPGVHIWDDSKRTLNISVGPNLLVENIGGEEDESVSIQTVFRYEQYFLDDDLVLFQETDLQRVVSGRENKILNTSTGFRWSLPRDMYMNIQVDFDYETNPADGSEKEDVTYLVGVGIELD